MTGPTPPPRRRKPDPPPLPTRDTLTVAVGTLVWAGLLVAAVVDRASLARHGHDWWIATAAVGTGLGILGALYCARRAARQSRRGQLPPGQGTGPAGG